MAKRGYCHRLGSIGNDPGARSWHANVLGWFRVKGFGFRGLGFRVFCKLTCQTERRGLKKICIVLGMFMQLKDHEYTLHDTANCIILRILKTLPDLSILMKDF